MRKIVFQPDALKEFLDLSEKNKKLFKKARKIIFEVLRDPFGGLNKPEPLKYEYQGYWSRRITDEHRLIYKVTDDEIIIVSCKYHY